MLEKIKKVSSVEDEEELVELIISYAQEKRFTLTNILDAVNKATKYMNDNAVLQSEDLT